MTAYLRAVALVLFACVVGAAVVYVWQLDPDPAPYQYHYPTSSTAGSR